MDENMILITKEEYKRLQNESEFLNCLRAAGVDNWIGYDDARGMMEEEEE